MKKLLSCNIWSFACAAFVVFACSTGARGEETKAGASCSTNLVPAEPPVPQSVFSLAEPCKDPFFPNSTRKRPKAAPVSSAPVFSTSLIALKGISGVPGQEVAIINNRNAAAGEHVEITLPNGATAGITVLNFHGYSADILVDGQRDPMTISLPKDDQ